MGGPQPALVGVRGPQAGGQYYPCGRHMSIPPGQVWEGGERTESKEEGEQLGREVKEEKSKREGLERGKDEEEVRRTQMKKEVIKLNPDQSHLIRKSQNPKRKSLLKVMKRNRLTTSLIKRKIHLKIRMCHLPNDLVYQIQV